MVGTKVKPHEILSNVFWVKIREGTERLATINLTYGETVYGENLIHHEKKEYRVWDHYRSKLAAAIIKKIKYVPIAQEGKILYLGAASGTTASHISDMVGKNGKVYCIEFSQRAMRELIEKACSTRENMYPILADARFPEKYGIVSGFVDTVYCDIAQPEQAKILSDNSRIFLKKNGWAILAIKSRSIDVTQEPKKIFKREIKVLKSNGFVIQDITNLEPYEKDHAMVTAKYHRK